MGQLFRRETSGMGNISFYALFRSESELCDLFVQVVIVIVLLYNDRKVLGSKQRSRRDLYFALLSSAALVAK